MDLSLYTLKAKVVFPIPGMPTMEMTSISAGPLLVGSICNNNTAALGDLLLYLFFDKLDLFYGIRKYEDEL
ncbi:hypothetical protein H5410_029508 [Solanum commersonii]|uniref:Uncharacterized protein n=1 Tax=Solanum commersonii TaxID=4109 RepID=A0A9J5Z7V9_SOLCO|nr:hypothetical protein H5410_029504 [Solanum commersonii]KAG5608016.1 hypothetical protein H5410_029508 [Solanum commersonii]